MSTVDGVEITKDVGTRMYMAPEMFKSKLKVDKNDPNYKELSRQNSFTVTSAVDIYALALVIVELFIDFRTTMERYFGLNVFKENEGAGYVMYKEEMKRFPFVVELVSKMLKKNWRDFFEKILVLYQINQIKPFFILQKDTTLQMF